ncbi:MAG: hypothetical protein Q9201_003895 [Fulgogasparrea decipioides]
MARMVHELECDFVQWAVGAFRSQRPDPMAPTFDKRAHVRYFLRCLKTHLPTAYTSNDSQRMTLAFFILSALDLLDALDTNITEAERTAYVDWIYRCQHPNGGFRGFTGTDMGERQNEENEHWDPANMAATYFALANLALLGDDLERVNRRGCRKWLKRLQLSDGTFGEALGRDGEVHGGRDMRFCFCAAAIRWILGGDEEKDEQLDVDGLLRFLEASQEASQTVPSKKRMVRHLLLLLRDEGSIAHPGLQLDGHIAP